MYLYYCIFSLLIVVSNSLIFNILPNTTNWQDILRNLKAGDVANIYSGTYTYSNFLGMTLVGTKLAPITIRGIGTTRPVLVQTNSKGQNNLVISGSWISMSYLTFTGGSEGLRLGPAPVNNSIFTNLIVFNTQSTAITANFAGAVFDNITLSYNEIYNTGTGTGECFYLGCSGNTCTFKNSIVTNNYCHHTLQAQGGAQGAGVQIKTGSYNNIISNNVCYMIKGPCVVVYDDYDLGPNRIIGNLLIQGLDNGIQATSGAVIANNIIINAASGISIQNANELKAGKQFRNITITHNTILNNTGTGSCLTLNGVSPTTNWLITNNVLMCPTSTWNIKISPFNGSPSNLVGVTVMSNVYFGGAFPAGLPLGGVSQSKNMFNELIGPSASGLNLYPTKGGLLPNKGARNGYPIDYNGNTRSSTAPTIGAYELTNPTNPGRPIGPWFKGTH